MRNVLILIGCSAVALILEGTAGAITFGELDGTAHPNVGALIAEWRTPGVKEEFCSGTLVAPTVPDRLALHRRCYWETNGTKIAPNLACRRCSATVQDARLASQRV